MYDAIDAPILFYIEYCSYACANLIIVRDVKIFRKKEYTLGEFY